MINIKIKDPGNPERPYEKCMAYGPGILTDSELLAVIIRTGTKGSDATDLAEKILSMSVQKNRLLCICHLDMQELMQVPGIGRVKAIQLLCIGELSKRIAKYKAADDLSFSDPCTISNYYMEQLRHEEQEYLICMMLDMKNHLLGEITVTKGTVNASLISTRELFIEAVKFHAVNIILVHNHPSGDPRPSKEDRKVTAKVRDAGNLMDINLMDHIIIGDKEYFSFRQENIL